MVQPESNPGFRATGSYGRGDPNIFKQSNDSQQSNNFIIPKLWEGNTPKVLNSLKQMGIVSTMPLENAPEIVAQPP